MGRQPYIPFYVGDYLKDTRALPLSVRGAWVDMIMFMWDNPVRGELIGTIQEVARMIGCDVMEAEFALNLLKQKRTADIDLLATGEWKISSRRMKRDAEISKKRSIAGKNGVKAKFAQANAEPKPKQIPDIDNDIEVDNDNKIGGAGGKDLPAGFDDWFSMFFDEIILQGYQGAFQDKDVGKELELFKLKVKNAWDQYRNRDTAGMRNAFQSHLKSANSKKNGFRRNGKESIERTQSFGTDYGTGLTPIRGDNPNVR